jgi:hypothetical protein
MGNNRSKVMADKKKQGANGAGSNGEKSNKKSPKKSVVGIEIAPPKILVSPFPQPAAQVWFFPLHFNCPILEIAEGIS